MFAKLAVRNVRRQLGNYLIYFITVAFTVALMFAVNNVIFSQQLLERAEAIRELSAGLTALTVFVSLIMAFVLGYATSFMLKLRKREFGTYLTLGMTRGNILAIFVLETLLLGIVALGVGILLGLFLYQGLMGIMTSLMEIPFEFAAYSLRGLILTVALVLGVFALSCVTSAVYLKKVSIHQLLHGDKVVEKSVRRPVSWGILTVFSLILIIVSCVAFSKELHASVFSGNSSGMGLFWSVFLLAVGIVLFHIGLARSAVGLLMKNKRLCCRGTNTFTLRQLSGKLASNSVMAGILAFLISFAVIGANVSFLQRFSEQVSLEKQYPFDIMLSRDSEGKSPISEQQGEELISQYAQIKEKLPYTIYESNNGYLHSFTRWTGNGYEDVRDCLISQSDLNRLYTAMGRQPVDLQGGFRILASQPQVQAYDFSAAQLTLGGKTYSYRGTCEMPFFASTYFMAVVPDEAVQGLTVRQQCAAYQLQDQKFDAQGLRQALTYTYEYNSASYGPISTERCDYGIKEYSRIIRYSSSAVFVLGALYLAVVFVFMAMAILALKTLSGLSEDKERYRVLFRLGASRRQQSQTLFRQTFSFFFLPFALPILLSIPTALICGQLTVLAGFEEHLSRVFANSGMIALVMAAIYGLYFTATYLTAKRNVVNSRPID